MIRKIVAPKLVDQGGNLKKCWYVDFRVYNEKTGKMQRFRKFKGFSNFTDAASRYLFGKKQVQLWTAKLKDKDYDPFEDNIVIVHNLLSYEIGPVIKVPAKYNIEYYFNQYFLKNEHRLRKKTFQSYQSKARIFCKWLELEKMDRDHPRFFHYSHAISFSEYLLKKRCVSNKTYNGYIVTLFSLWKNFIRFEIASENPWGKVDRLKTNSVSLRPFSLKQSELILKHLKITDPWLLFFCQFQYYSLTRPCSEQRLLRLADIDWHNQVLKVRGEFSKNHKTQNVALSNSLFDQISKFNLESFPTEYYIFGKNGPSPTPVSKDYFTKRFRKVLTELGIGKEWSMYSWKHTMNQRSAIKGIPLKEMQMQNRHHSLDQFDQYLKGLTVLDGHNLYTNLPEM